MKKLVNRERILTAEIQKKEKKLNPKVNEGWET